MDGSNSQPSDFFDTVRGGRMLRSHSAFSEANLLKDATQLDTWVFDKVKAFFGSATTNATLGAALREDKLVFFLHLLGLDTTGHAYRPYSKEYLHNIKVVDEGVREITELIEDFYQDGRTAYVFTADHGMSDWGSHGDGHPDNTRTPLIAWGAGVAKPVISSDQDGPAAGHKDGFSADWNLDRIQRNDVSQADIAALLAHLGGLDYPVNSVGELPLAYLAGSPKEKAEALLVNAREILEMYRTKEARKRSTELRYRPFPPLGDEARSIDHRLATVRSAIDDNRPDEAIEQSLQLMQLGLQGLRYLQTYDWLFLRALVTAGYLGWIVFALTTMIDLHVLRGTVGTSRTLSSVIFFSSILTLLYSLLWMQRSSWTYYAYALFPVLFWEEVVARRRGLAEGLNVLVGHVGDVGVFLSLGIKSLSFVALLEVLVSGSPPHCVGWLDESSGLTFAALKVQGYSHREMFSICFIFAAFWPAVYGWDFLRQNTRLLATWALACFAMSVFTLLPVVKVEDINLMFVHRLAQ